MAAGPSPFQVNTQILLTLMEYLCHNGQYRASIANYMSALRTFHIVHGSET